MLHNTDDLRIVEINELLPPIALTECIPLTESSAKTVYQARNAIHNLLHGDDDRLLVIVGPCSIHDIDAALEYAGKISEARQKYGDRLEIVMRVYFEKPRTTVGWKGLINDPYLDNSFRLNQGLRLARKLLRDITEMGVPTAGEFLDMIIPQYTGDLVSWGAIGARTTESQVHRELASGLSCPVGFKNGTDGNIKIAADAIRSASASHHFLSVTKFGHSAIVTTTGNEDTHIILRGGNKGPNYNETDVQRVLGKLKEDGLPTKVMIDFSHANSCKDFHKQHEVCNEVVRQVSGGEYGIFGVMIESHLVEGRQDLVEGKAPVYGQSITDACIGWEETEQILGELAQAVEARRHAN